MENKFEPQANLGMTKSSYFNNVLMIFVFIIVAAILSLGVFYFWENQVYKNRMFNRGSNVSNYGGDFSDISTSEKHEICIQYNDGLRSGSCTEDAPSYCMTVYYPPSCDGCQDGEGCGYKE